MTGTVLSAASRALAAAGIDTPAFEARVLIGHVMDINPGAVTGSGKRLMSTANARIVNHIVALRCRRMPLNYVLRNAQFMGLRFRTDDRALSPRQETELLAEMLMERMQRRSPVNGLLVDVGCGCGVLCLSAAHSFPALNAVGSDVSVAALQLFHENVAALGLAGRVQAVAGAYLDWLSRDGAELVRYLVSNPPYVRPADYETLQPEIVRYEPRLALVSASSDGLDAYRRIASRLPDMTRLEVAAFEIGCDQVEVADIMRKARPDLTWNIEKDYAGHSRIVIGDDSG